MINTTTANDLKDEGLALAERYRKATLLKARRLLLRELLRTLKPTSIDAIREKLQIPPGINPVMLGATPRALVAAGIIRQCGFTTSQRTAAHHRPVSLWELVEVHGARSWLVANPDPDEADPPVFDGAQRLMFPVSGEA